MSEEIKLLSRNPAHFIRQAGFKQDLKQDLLDMLPVHVQMVTKSFINRSYIV